LESILLYLITLSFFVKVLLFDNGAQAELDVYSEVISFVFLIFIVAEKKSRAAGEAAERVPEESGEVRRVRVRRGGYEVACLSEEVVQGDIVLLEAGDFLRFDAILLDIVGEGEVAVNEE
jgi:magnesium-transporting ATPase (P-type)